MKLPLWSVGVAVSIISLIYLIPSIGLNYDFTKWASRNAFIFAGIGIIYGFEKFILKREVEI